jgi:hypothetical protein
MQSFLFLSGANKGYELRNVLINLIGSLVFDIQAVFVSPKKDGL